MYRLLKKKKKQQKNFADIPHKYNVFKRDNERNKTKLWQLETNNKSLILD